MLENAVVGLIEQRFQRRFDLFRVAVVGAQRAANLQRKANGARHDRPLCLDASHRVFGRENHAAHRHRNISDLAFVEQRFFGVEVDTATRVIDRNGRTPDD